MIVRMLVNKFGAGGVLYAAGSTQDLPVDVAARYVFEGVAVDTANAMALPITDVSAAQAAAIARSVRGPLLDSYSSLLPTHLPVLSPERHSAMTPIVNGGLTCSFVAGGERGRGKIRLSTAGVMASTAIRLPLPLGAEYGTYARMGARLNIRITCDNWNLVRRLYVGPADQGGSTHYHLLKIIENGGSGGVSRYGMTDPANAAKWNNVWRTLNEHSDKKIIVGTPAPWDGTSRYFSADGLVFTVWTDGAVAIEFDRCYSPIYSVGGVVDIFDGAYKSARDIVLPAYAGRGWRAGFSGNKVDGSTLGVTTYPTMADLASVAAQGHDVFMHGHDLSGSAPTPMTGAVTEAKTLEVLTAGRGAIAGAVGGAGARGLRWHQWLQNTGSYAGTDMAGLLKTMGIGAARGSCSDAEFGINPYDTVRTSTWDAAPATVTGGVMSGWQSYRGRFNRPYMETFAGATPLDRDTYAGSAIQKCVEYAANCGDLLLSYTHNIVSYDGTNPLVSDTGINRWRDYDADVNARVKSGSLIKLGPTDLEMLTYWNPGDVYLSWDGEWRNRSDESIAF